MKKSGVLFMQVLLTFIMICFEGCYKDDDDQSSTTQNGSWAIYTPFNWTHDGQPYQSAYFTVYSDAAGGQMKQQMGQIADKNFSELIQLFNLQDLSDLIYPPGYQKIEIYLNIYHTENINWAYWGGFIITIRSVEISGKWLDYTLYTARHELTHILDFLIEGREIPGTDVWLREGLAVNVGCMESTAFKTINTLTELESWESENSGIPGNGNPIMIHRHSDLPAEREINDYYRIFELAARYIVDVNGLGKSYEDILNLLYDLRNNIPFQSAFSNNLGLNIADFENDFYDIMRVYLTRGEKNSCTQTGNCSAHNEKGCLSQNYRRICLSTSR